MNIGTIIQWGSNTIPDNWLLCDGSAVSRTTYADLFAVIGTNFGTGDGSTTFNLPDLRGRVGVGKSSDTEFDTLGETGGEKTHTLTTTEMPSHYHTNSHYAVGSNAPGYYGWEENVGSGSSGTYRATANSESTGGGQAHNNLQPYVVTNYIIKALVEDKVKISELDSATSIDGTEVMPIVQSGTTKKIAIDTISNGIIDSGSNANGSYIKYANGSLICNAVVGPVTTASMNGTTSQITLPYNFVDGNYITNTEIVDGQAYWGDIQVSTGSKTASGFTLAVWNSGSGSNTNQYFNYTAIGRWK